MTAGRLVSYAALCLFGYLVWAFVLPPSLGGPTSYLVTKGVSMEPYLRQGDTTMVRESKDYDVGDVVAFNDRVINAVSMHRIIAEDADGRYTTKGDNNDWIDIHHPSNADIIGKLVFKSSGVSGALEGLTSVPVRILGGLLLAWAVYGLAFGRRRAVETQTTERKAPRLDAPSARFPIDSRRAPAMLMALFLLSASFIGLSFVPAPKDQTAVLYNFIGDYQYSGIGRAGSENIYADRQVDTGEPVYLSLVDDLLVSYRFRLDTPADFQGVGSYRETIVLQGKTGWSHTLVETRPVPFVNQKAFQKSTSLDLVALRAKAVEIRDLTKANEQGFSVIVTPTVELDGMLAGAPFEKTFTTELTLEADEVALRAAPATAPSQAPGLDPDTAQPILTGLTPRFGGKLEVPGSGQTRIAAFGVEVLSSTLRTIGFIGLGVALLGLALWSNVVRRQPRVIDVHEQAVRQYQRMFVPVTPPTDERFVDVSSLDVLARIADNYEALIFEQIAMDAITYFCDHGGTRYRYVHPVVTAADRFGATDTTPVATEP